MREGSTKPIILVVEDEALIRMSAVDFLEDAGFATLQANNAPDACAIFASRDDIVAVFTDLEMGGAFDGLVLVREVHSKRPEVLVLVTSGRLSPLAQTIPSDCAFLPKPYSPNEVTSALRDLPCRVIRF
jgi:DNA-binding NtrC family response regulator